MMLTITIFYCEAVRLHITSEHSDLELLSEFLNDVISCLNINILFYHTASKRNLVMLKVAYVHLVYL